MKQDNIDRILELIDAGLGRSGDYGFATSMNQGRCERSGCKTAPAQGHSYCRPCLAWLRCETDDDPLAKDPPAIAPVGTVDGMSQVELERRLAALYPSGRN